MTKTKKNMQSVRLSSTNIFFSYVMHTHTFIGQECEFYLFSLDNKSFQSE